MRRVQGAGSVSQRADGSWAGSVELNRSPGEPRRRKTWSGATEEEVRAKVDAWVAEHRPEIVSDPPIRGSRRELLMAARVLGSHTDAEWRAKLAAADGCHYCHRPFDFKESKDHATPLSRGGSDGLDNVVAACWDCNKAKRQMTEPEFREWAAGTGFFTQPRTVSWRSFRRFRTPARRALT